MPRERAIYKGLPLDPNYNETSAAQAVALRNYITGRINAMLGK
jgi:hypothetical protein